MYEEFDCIMVHICTYVYIMYESGCMYVYMCMYVCAVCICMYVYMCCMYVYMYVPMGIFCGSVGLAIIMLSKESKNFLKRGTNGHVLFMCMYGDVKVKICTYMYVCMHV